MLTMGSSPQSSPEVMEPGNHVTTKLVVEMLLVVVGSISLVLFALFGISTAITRSTWWYRRRRAYLRRMDLTGRAENIPLEDKLFHYTSYILESISFTSGESEPETKKTSTRTKFGRSSFSREEGQQPGLPLRFQPEKLYGTVSTVHRDNLRKKSWSSLAVQPPTPSSRRASMVDSLLQFTASPRIKGSSKASASVQPVPTLTHTYPQQSLANSWNVGQVPQIDVTCAHDESEIEATADSYENLTIVGGSNKQGKLTVTLPARRASSTNFELLNTRQDRKLSLNEEKFKKPSTSAHSDVEANSCEQTPKNKKREFGYLLSDKRPGLGNLIQRRSTFWSDTSMFRSSRKETGEISTAATADESTDTEKVTEFVQPIPLPTEEKNQLKLPTSPPVLDKEDCAGLIALALTLGDPAGSSSSKLRVQLFALKGLKPQKPWQKLTYNLRCTYRVADMTQHASLQFKAAELKPFSSRKNFELSFDWASQSYTNDELQLQLFECASKWSGEKDHFHGSLSIPLEDSVIDKATWYIISPAYPMIRIKADVLVSLCQRPLEGLLSIGVHEIRNIDFDAYGPWDMENLNEELKHRQIEVAVHACLFHDGRLSKSRKSIFLQRPGYPPIRSSRGTSSLSSGPKNSADGDSTTSGVPFNRLVGGEHFLQFSLPALKKSFGKLPLSDYAVVLFFFNKLQVTDRLPLECVRQIRSVGLTEAKNLNAIGECFIGDQNAQLDYRKEHGLVPKVDVQSSSLWSEVNSHGSSRVYQWLSVE